MIGELESRQILALSAQGGTPSEIATQLGVEEAMVKLVLARHGEKNLERDINDDELAALRHHAFRLATEANDETVQARLTMFLIERDKPRKEGSSSPIMAINQALVLAQNDFQKLLAEHQT